MQDLGNELLKNHLETSIPKNEMVDLRHIFGENSNISVLESGHIQVALTLRDAIEEGGQHVDIELGERKHVSKDEDLSFSVHSVDVYPAERLTINNRDMTDEFKTLYFEVRSNKPSMKSVPYGGLDKLLKLAGDNQMLKDFAYRAGLSTVFSRKEIFIPHFENADDLLGVFHEDGHLFDPDFIPVRYMEALMNVGRSVLVVAQNGGIGEHRKQILHNISNFLNFEKRASQLALQNVSRLNSQYELFPTDQDGWRARRCYEHMLLEYVKDIQPIKNELTPHEISQLTDVMNTGNIV